MHAVPCLPRRPGESSKSEIFAVLAEQSDGPCKRAAVGIETRQKHIQRHVRKRRQAYYLAEHVPTVGDNIRQFIQSQMLISSSPSFLSSAPSSPPSSIGGGRSSNPIPSPSSSPPTSPASPISSSPPLTPPLPPTASSPAPNIASMSPKPLSTSCSSIVPVPAVPLARLCRDGLLDEGRKAVLLDRAGEEEAVDVAKAGR